MRHFVFLVLLTLAANVFAATETAPPEHIVPPAPLREFRGVWVATVGNSCWPSKPGLSTEQQKAELIAILDRAASLKLNAIVFQVRPACDALYQSSIEPWSEYLTGIQGRAPSPYYDPLAFAVSEAHRRGLELHAWFNPFRAHHFQSVSPMAVNHISRTHPQLVRSYGRYLWLDPGEPEVRAYSQRVVMDVVKRYDIDGVHFDDYFYPYHEKGRNGGDLDFPDTLSWDKYGKNSGMVRDDWRRMNVDLFMQQIYHAIKAEKPWVKFGISPFGIWRPKNPPTISGFDSYAELYADSRKWLLEGWCDYFSPQLYWPIQPPAQSFPVLLGWWDTQNPHHRHIWPGLDALKVGGPWRPSEIENQIVITRHYPNPGHILWSSSSIMKNGPLDTMLSQALFQQPALIPASPWLEKGYSPGLPKLSVTIWGRTTHAQWQAATNKPASLWLWQTLLNGVWNTQIFPVGRTDLYLDNVPIEAAAVRAVDRVGILSEPAVWIAKKYTTPDLSRGMNRLVRPPAPVPRAAPSINRPATK